MSQSLPAPVCSAAIATLNEVDEILSFYKDHPHTAVYLRNRDDLAQSVQNNLFLVVRNTSRGEIVAASGIYVLANGEVVDCIIKGGEAIAGRVAELGSVERWREGLPSGYDGVWHPFLFTVPKILFSERVGVRSDELNVDFLVCDVQVQERSNRERLQGHVVLTPCRWREISPAQGLVSAFQNTIDPAATNMANPKLFYQDFPNTLPLAAKYLRQIIAGGALINQSGAKLPIDMSSLVEQWTVSPAGEQRVTILDRIVANDRTISNLHDAIGWAEWGRVKAAVQSNPGQPLKFRNGGIGNEYHHTVNGNGAATSADASRRLSSAFNGTGRDLAGRTGDVRRTGRTDQRLEGDNLANVVRHHSPSLRPALCLG